MTSWLRWIALQAALTQATMVAIRVTAGYRALDFDAGPAGIGLVASAFAIPALLAAIPAGRASDRFGGAAVSAVGIGLNTTGIITSIIANSLPLLVVACAVSGLGHVTVIVAQQVFVSQHADDHDSDGAFGILTAASSVGQLIAPPAVGLALTFPIVGAQDSISGMIVALGFAALSVIGIVPLVRKDHRRFKSYVAQDTSFARRPPFSTLWRAVLVSGVILAAIDLLYSFLPLWASERGVTPLQVGILLSIRAAIAVAARFGIGRLVERFGRKGLILFATCLATASFGVLPFVGLIGAAIAMVGLGIGLALPQPLTVTWLLAGVNVTERGRLLGLRMTANRAAQSAIPLAVGVVAAPLGTSGVFIAAAALLASAAIVTSTATITEPPPASEGR